MAYLSDDDSAGDAFDVGTHPPTSTPVAIQSVLNVVNLLGPESICQLFVTQWVISLY